MKRLAIAVLLVFASCSNSHTGARAKDSKSNWLRECVGPSDCGDGLSCLCGVCTVSCDDTAGCDREGEAAAVCIEADGCASSVCFAVCGSDAECGEEQRCVEGGCITTMFATSGNASDACVALPVTCNAADDDCDGRVDEDASQTCDRTVLNADSTCVPFGGAATCVMMRCREGYANCDANPSNGCESPFCTCNLCPDAGL